MYLANTLNVTYGYDLMGNMTRKNDCGSPTTYVYDYENQLTQITLPGGKWEKFYYDGVGRRVKTEYYNGATTTTRKFVYLGGSVIREMDNSLVTVRPIFYTCGRC